jgi:hypothetical protein
VINREMPRCVIPAKAGIQWFSALLDTRLRGCDDPEVKMVKVRRSLLRVAPYRDYMCE